MSFTIQSESVPEVEATILAIGWPLIFRGDVRTSEMKVSTSVRPEASRWSSTSHSDQVSGGSYPMGWMGRVRNGTGLDGSEMYSSNSVPVVAGASKESL